MCNRTMGISLTRVKQYPCISQVAGYRGIELSSNTREEICHANYQEIGATTTSKTKQDYSRLTFSIFNIKSFVGRRNVVQGCHDQ
jgi:hypothetical protein